MAYLIYKNINHQLHEIEMENHEVFKIFIKANLFEIIWAKYYEGVILIDEYTNLSHNNIQLSWIEANKDMIGKEFVLLSKWNIELFKDFFKKHYKEDCDFWESSPQFLLGSIIRKTKKDSTNNVFSPQAPVDLILVPASYLANQIADIQPFIRTTEQVEEARRLNQFIWITLGF